MLECWIILPKKTFVVNLEWLIAFTGNKSLKMKIHIYWCFSFFDLIRILFIFTEQAYNMAFRV